MNTKPLSKRRIKSYQAAEAVAQELRYQIANWQEWDAQRLSDLLCKWISTTPNKICYARPSC